MAETKLTDIQTKNTCAFRAYASTAQNVTQTTWVVIGLDDDSTGTAFDIGGDFNTTTHRFVAPVDGIYHFDGLITLNNLFDGEKMITSLHLNGGSVAYAVTFGQSTTTDPSCGASATLSMSATDYVELQCYHYHASYRILDITHYQTYLTGHLVAAI